VSGRREPIFNVPLVVLATLAALAFVHLARVYALSPQGEVDFLLRFAFIPARYEASLLPAGAFPGGAGAELWTFVTYALIHADATHLGFNAVWLLAFGVPVARRFGGSRFLILLAASAAAGAAAHLVTHARDIAPMVGASAAVSGAMAAAMRFVFQRGGPIALRRTDAAAYRIPAIPLHVALADPRVLVFLAVWFGINLVFGLGVVSIGDGQPVAWQAHIGGFLAGLLLFGVFDPVPRRAPGEGADGGTQ
jgi:membrane associated rhomboid family serine protease